jgi:hypothetical protein
VSARTRAAFGTSLRAAMNVMSPRAGERSASGSAAATAE